MGFTVWRKACEVGDEEVHDKPSGDYCEVKQCVSVESEH